MPLLLLPIAAMIFPESPRFLASRNSKDVRIRKILQRVGIDSPLSASYVVSLPEITHKRFPILALFRGKFSFVTPALWTMAALTLISVTLFGMIPTFFHELASVPLSHATAVLSLGLTGSLLAGIGVGFAMDRLGEYRILAMSAVCGCASLLALTILPFGSKAFLLAIFLAGFFVNAAQQAVNILTPCLYPSQIRGAAVGWKGGFGRLASSLAPLTAAVILTNHLSVGTALVVPAALLAVSALTTPVLYWCARGMQPIKAPRLR